MKIRKAVLPVAGLGTRFLPATKAQPKEMLPIVDKPLVQYAVEEVAAAGIPLTIFVTGRGKTTIENHFDVSAELEHELSGRGKEHLLKQVRAISSLCNVVYLRQKHPKGLGHAVLMSRDVVDDEPFAVVLSDDVIDSQVPCLRQMTEVFNELNACILAIERVPKSTVGSYGIIKAEPVRDSKWQGRLFRVTDLVEKPSPADAPSNMAIIGRYILTPAIFRKLASTRRGKGGEVQLTDALKSLLRDEPIYGFLYEGKRYDAGDKLGFLKATVEYALKEPNMGGHFRKYLKSLKL
ncbi:MAG TPA: UTP--glucose-1-phosphate uridylyltransferase GalU [Terriglobia bacterium]|nr:UTP--glucose-1-phosphate uridylyltransferase GalU [Terriglobia bacterium]